MRFVNRRIIKINPIRFISPFYAALIAAQTYVNYANPKFQTKNQTNISLRDRHRVIQIDHLVDGNISRFDNWNDSFQLFETGENMCNLYFEWMPLHQNVKYRIELD